jgi:hypothetical protein
MKYMMESETKKGPYVLCYTRMPMEDLIYAKRLAKVTMELIVSDR